MARLKKEDLFYQWEDLYRQARDLATTAQRRVQIPSIPNKSYQRTTMQELKDMIACLRQLINEWTAEDAQLSEAETALIMDTAGVDAVHAHLEEWEAAWANYISKLKRIEDLEAQGRYGYQLRQPRKAVELAVERLYQIDPDMCRRLGIVPISACGQPETAQPEANEYQSMTMEELLLVVLFCEDEERKKAAQAEVNRRNGLEAENGPVSDSNDEVRVTLFTYGSNAFTVPVNRLQRYLDEHWDGISVDDFLDFYTWDDSQQVLQALQDAVKLV